MWEVEEGVVGCVIFNGRRLLPVVPSSLVSVSGFWFLIFHSFSCRDMT